MKNYKSDRTFRALLETGNYVYVDGHLCLDRPEFVNRIGYATLQLTTWARAHIDACCLRFKRVYESSDSERLVAGILYCKDGYADQYFSLAPNYQSKATEAEKNREAACLLKSMPTDFPGARAYLIRAWGTNTADLSARCGIPQRTLDRLREETRGSYPPDKLIAICIGLNLPPQFSMKLLETAHFVWQDTDQHFAYRTILYAMYKEPLSKIQEYLEKAECQPLQLGIRRKTEEE